MPPHLCGRRRDRLSLTGQRRIHARSCRGDAPAWTKDGNLRINDIPTGIYTSPEISSVGKTERELTDRLRSLRSRTEPVQKPRPAQIIGTTVGMLKLLFHRETLEILGVHCFGANASEIVHIGQAVMNQDPPQ